MQLKFIFQKHQHIGHNAISFIKIILTINKICLRIKRLWITTDIQIIIVIYITLTLR